VIARKRGEGGQERGFGHGTSGAEGEKKKGGPNGYEKNPTPPGVGRKGGNGEWSSEGPGKYSKTDAQSTRRNSGRHVSYTQAAKETHKKNTLTKNGENERKQTVNGMKARFVRGLNNTGDRRTYNGPARTDKETKRGVGGELYPPHTRTRNVLEPEKSQKSGVER